MDERTIISGTELLLARHGETLENQRNILQGQMPGTLSEKGWEQARQLGELLRNNHIDCVVCSDLARSYNTAKVVADLHNLKPIVTPLLREMDWGIYTGQSLQDVDWYNLPQSVESVEALYRRAGEFIAFIRSNFPSKRVLAIGHGAFNRAIEVYISGGEPFDMLSLPIMENVSFRLYPL